MLSSMPCYAQLEWEVLRSLKSKESPIEIEFSATRQQIFVLNDKGQVSFYDLNGRLDDTIDVGRQFNRMRLLPGTDIILLSSSKTREIQIVRIDFVQEIDTVGSPFKGLKDAPVIIAVFSDFQCGSCRMLATLLDEVVEKYPKTVKVVFKHFPLRSHKFSRKASISSMAAEKQGKFWDFHDAVFFHSNELSDGKISQIAQDVGLDMQKYQKDLNDPGTAALVDKDAREGLKIGVRSTPTVFINGRKLSKADRSIEGFSEAVEKALKEKK